MRYVIFDISNLLYRTFYANKSDDDTTLAGLAHHSALTTLNKYFKELKPDKVIMTFDRPNWRKDYTKTDKCLSKRKYKGNRRQKMTPAEKIKYDVFCEHLTDFEEMMRVHTSIVCLAADKLEADDLMAGFVQTYDVLDENAEFIVVTADKDMVQLLEFDNVRLLDPASGKDRNLDDFENDVGLFMFEKCIRGDRGDNVMSAFPRVRRTRILKAYHDDFEKNNLLNETWYHPKTKEHPFTEEKPKGTLFKVKDVYRENQLLMDLNCQPDDIRRLIVNTIVKEMDNPGIFSYFHFMQFLGKFEMKKIAQNVETFLPLLSR